MSMDAIRAHLLGQTAQNTQKTPTSRAAGQQFPFWNTPTGGTTTIRFVPDADGSNLFAFVERRSIKLSFDGVEGGDYPTSNPVTVTVPCLETWGKKCPITEAIRPLWKGDEDDKNKARLYYRKPSFLYAGFVVNAAFAEENPPANPIRVFTLNKSLHEAILAALAQPDFEETPWSYTGGRDFRISVSSRGQFKDYSKSQFSMKPRDLSEAEHAAIAEHGLVHLRDLLGQEPDAATVEQIKAMFQDSLAGRPFDAVAYPAFRAFGDRSSSSTTSPVSAATAASGPTYSPHEMLTALRQKTTATRSAA